MSSIHIQLNYKASLLESFSLTKCPVSSRGNTSYLRTWRSQVSVESFVSRYYNIMTGRFLDIRLPDILLYHDLSVEYQRQPQVWLWSGFCQNRHLLFLPVSVRLGRITGSHVSRPRSFSLCQGGCALFSGQRYRQGFEAAFTDIEGGEYHQQEPPFQGELLGDQEM